MPDIIHNADSKKLVDTPIKASWRRYQRDHHRGEVVTGPIIQITDYGLIVDLESDIKGIVHLSDIRAGSSGEEHLAEYYIGLVIDTVILSIEPERERVSLGIKQLSGK